MSSPTTIPGSQPATDVPEHPLYKGSCHCGAITYTARLNLTTPDPATGMILTKCNCSVCHKSGLLAALVEPRSSFTDTSPALSAAEGEGGGDGKGSALVNYTFGDGKIRHSFCGKCGVRCFYHGKVSIAGRPPFEFTRVNVLTVDGKVDGGPMEDLRNLSVAYWDGKTNGWAKGAASKPYEGGYW